MSERNQLQRTLAWLTIVALVALVGTAVLQERSDRVVSLAGVWHGELLAERGELPVSMVLPGLFGSQGLATDAHIRVSREVVLPDDGVQRALWLERPQFAVEVGWDGRALAAVGDPHAEEGARNETSLLVWLPREPGRHILSLDLRGDYGEGGLIGRLLLGPTQQIERIARIRETERLGLALVLSVLAFVHLGVTTRRPSRPTFLLFGLFCGTFALWAYMQSDMSSDLLALVHQIRVRRVVYGLFPALGLAFVVRFLYGRTGRWTHATLGIGGITSLLGLLLPVDWLFPVEVGQDVLLVVTLLGVGAACVHGSLVGLRGAPLLLVATVPPLVLAAVSDVLVSHGLLEGNGLLFPAATFFVVGIAVALALRHADDADRHERLLASSPDAILSVGDDGRVAALNPSARGLLGLAAEGARFSDQVVVEDRHLLRLHLARDLPRVELRLMRAPDRVFESVVTPLDEDATLLVLRDVTRRRQLDGVILQSARLETVGGLVGGIAHDFNNMLGTLLAQLGFLQLGTDEDGGLQRMRRMEGTIERASLLVRRMLTVARGTSPELEPIDLGGLCEGARELVEPTLPESVTLTLDVPPHLPAVLGAGADLEQVLVNLIVNARDAVATGGHVAVRARHLLLRDTEAVVLVVEDDGPGVPDDQKADVFLPFVSTKSPRRGSGLGLAVASQIVRDHRGRLWVEDRPGGGARFLAALRIAHGGLDDDDALPVDRRVLLVEDESELLESFAAALRDAGYDVTACGSGEVALEALRDRAPAILVSDVVLPGCSGIDLAETCNTLYPEVPILLVSGYVPPQRARTLDGRWHHLDKPVRSARLVAEVGRICRRTERRATAVPTSEPPSHEVSLLHIRGSDLQLDRPAWRALSEADPPVKEAPCTP